MPVDERKFTHVRLNQKRASKMKRITDKTHRSINVETGLAVDQYRPRIVKFKDNGK